MAETRPPNITTAGINLIMGLGNPGPDYANTRHNAGAWFVEALSQHYQIPLKNEPKFSGKLGQGTIQGREVKLLISNTFMNHSGRALSLVANYYHIPLNAILVAHDELDLPPGIVRFKTGGGHGGHNGLRDIMQVLGGQEFHRLRLGIGHPGHRDHVVDYVLQRPSRNDDLLIRGSIDKAIDHLSPIILGEWEKAMNKLHTESNSN